MLIIHGIVISAIHAFGSYGLEYFVKDLFGLLPEESVFEVVLSLNRLTIPQIFDSFVYYTLALTVLHGVTYYKELVLEKAKALELENSMNELKLKNLQSQLHPHFLFNALNTISSLIERFPNKAIVVTNDLGVLLRSHLQSDQSQLHELRSELNLIYKYLDIQKVRFEDKLEVEIDVEESTLKYPIPSLVLLPMVENAFKHGLEPDSRNGKLGLKIKEVDSRIIITVSDSGLGMKSEYVKFGVGLTNVTERLKLFYGNEASFKIHNNPERGVIAQIDIPKKLL